MPKLPKNGRSLPEIPHPLCPPDLLSQINQTDRDQKQQEATPQLESSSDKIKISDFSASKDEDSTAKFSALVPSPRPFSPTTDTQEYIPDMFKPTGKKKGTKEAQATPTSGTGPAPADGPGQAQEKSVGPTTPPNPSTLFQKGLESMQKMMAQQDTENQAGAASGTATASIPANPEKKDENQRSAEPTADKLEQKTAGTQDEAMKEDEQNNENKKSEESGPKTDQEGEQMKDVGQEQMASSEQLEEAEEELSTPKSSPRSRHSKSKLENHKGFPSPAGGAQTGHSPEPKKQSPGETSQTSSAKKTVKGTQRTLLNFFSKPEQPPFPFVPPRSNSPLAGTEEGFQELGEQVTEEPMTDKVFTMEEIFEKEIGTLMDMCGSMDPAKIELMNERLWITSSLTLLPILASEIGDPLFHTAAAFLNLWTP